MIICARLLWDLQVFTVCSMLARKVWNKISLIPIIPDSTTSPSYHRPSYEASLASALSSYRLFCAMLPIIGARLLYIYIYIYIPGIISGSFTSHHAFTPIYPLFLYQDLLSYTIYRLLYLQCINSSPRTEEGMRSVLRICHHYQHTDAVDILACSCHDSLLQ